MDGTFSFSIGLSMIMKRVRYYHVPEEQAFEFLYGLYGSKFTDTTDEDLDVILKENFQERIFVRDDNDKI